MRNEGRHESASLQDYEVLDASDMSMAAGRRDWRSVAACRTCDPDLFFPVSSSGLSLEQMTQAKKICAHCPVRPQCLAFALRTRQVHGVWGGTSEQERYLLWTRDERRIDPGAGKGSLQRLPTAQ